MKIGKYYIGCGCDTLIWDILPAITIVLDPQVTIVNFSWLCFSFGITWAWPKEKRNVE